MKLSAIVLVAALSLQCIACCQPPQHCEDQEGTAERFLAVPYDQFIRAQEGTRSPPTETEGQSARSAQSSSKVGSRERPQHTETSFSNQTNSPCSKAAAQQLTVADTPQDPPSQPGSAGRGTGGILAGTVSSIGRSSNTTSVTQQQLSMAPSTLFRTNQVGNFVIPTADDFHTKADYSAVLAPTPVGGLALLLPLVALCWLSL